MHEQRLSPRIASRLLEAVELRCGLAGIPPPYGPASRSEFEAIRRDGRTGNTDHPTGLRWHQADAAAAGGGGTYLGKIRNGAIIALGSDALLRTGEIAALDTQDLAVPDDGTGRITIRSHDGAGQPALAFLGVPTVRRIRKWLDESEIEDGPLFREMYAYRAASARPSARGVQLAIGRYARVGRFLSRVNANSLRIGSALSLAKAGASLDEILEAGRWTTPAREDPARGPVARRRYGSG